MGRATPYVGPLLYLVIIITFVQTPPLGGAWEASSCSTAMHSDDSIRCWEQLGGLLQYDHREAACIFRLYGQWGKKGDS